MKVIEVDTRVSLIKMLYLGMLDGIITSTVVTGFDLKILGVTDVVALPKPLTQVGKVVTRHHGRGQVKEGYPKTVKTLAYSKERYLRLAENIPGITYQYIQYPDDVGVCGITTRMWRIVVKSGPQTGRKTTG